MNSFRPISLPLLFLLAVFRLQGGEITVESPDQAETFAYGSTKHHLLRWDKKKGQLYAEITFSNEPYARNTTASEETFQFYFPGVKQGRNPAPSMSFTLPRENDSRLPKQSKSFWDPRSKLLKTPCSGFSAIAEKQG